MKKSVFSASKLSGLSAVTRGTKANNDVRPAITTARGINKFTMNASASALMQVQHNDRVVMFSLPKADSIDEKFFIAAAAGSEGCKLSSAGKTKGVGRPQSFNYAGIWSQMLAKDKDAAPMGEAILVDKGLMAEATTQVGADGEMCKTILAVKKVEYGLEPVVDEEGEFIPVEVDGVTYEKVFVLTKPKDVYVVANDEDANDSEDVVYESDSENDSI